MSPARFFVHRGLAQMRIESPEDLERVRDLEAARWSATSVPNEQLFADPAFLAAVDADKSGRIRRHEVLAALEWLKPRVKDKSRMFAPRPPQGGPVGRPDDVVRLADLDVTHPDVERIVLLATQRLGKAGADATVSLAEVRAFQAGYKMKHPNGDGVVTAAQCTGDVAALVKQGVETVGGAPDVSGEPGLDDKELDELVARAAAVRAWRAERTWSAETTEAAARVEALAAKLEQFFALCDLVGQESHAAARLTATAEQLAVLDVKHADAVRAFVADAPLARPNADGVLDANGWLNPAYADDVRALFASALPKLLQRDAGSPARLTRDDWRLVQEAVAPLRAHAAKEPPAVPAELAELTGDDERVRTLRRLIEEDRTASKEIDALADLERVALMQRWLVELLNNMVSFPTLFRAPGGGAASRALFEAGTLILDGRELHFCVRAPDIAGHKKVAERSNLFVVYVELERKDGDVVHKQQIAAAVTSGQRRGIAVGKRGIFYDRDGKEHEARVLDLIERPISLLEATLAPFIRVRDAVLGFVEKTTAGKLDALEKKAADPPVVPLAPPAPPPPAKAAQPDNGLTGKLMGGGIAIAALGSGAAFMLQTLANIELIDAVLAVASVALVIAALAGFLGWLRLRRRDLSTMLEACGWAFNARIYLNRRHALRFTRVPPLPAGSERSPVLLPAVAADEDDGTTSGVLVFALVGALAAAAVAFREPLLRLLGLAE